METMSVTSLQCENEKNKVLAKDSTKRSAEQSPDGGNKRVFSDITNQTNNKKNATVPKKCIKSAKSTNKSSYNSISECSVISESIPKCDMQEEEKENSEMYTTACEEMITDHVEGKEIPKSKEEEFEEKSLPPNVEDFDESCLSDPYSEPIYASFIFNYLKERENQFPIVKYMDKQPEMTKNMRSILVDWMVEVQESFELNHETLYLGVKLFDLYCMKHNVSKMQIQLIGATALWLAGKFDERTPPSVEDFLYICDDSYTRQQMIQTEIKMLQTVNYDLGIPLSYRFLRRYSRCSRQSMDLLTLARYILETSLMDYDLSDASDSKIAAAALLLALKMKNQSWTPTLQHYSGYQEPELLNLLYCLNKNISGPASKHLQTIRTKYSHPIFFEVAKVPPLVILKSID